MKKLIILSAIIAMSISCRTVNYNWKDQGNLETGVRYLPHDSHVAARITSNRLIRRTGKEYPHRTIIHKSGMYFVVLSEGSFIDKKGRKILTRRQVKRIREDWR